MIRVLFPFEGTTVGGSHVSAALLIQGLRRHGGTQPLVLLHRFGPLASYLDAQGIPYEIVRDAPVVHNPRLVRQFVASLRCSAPLADVLRRYRSDVVHTNDGRMHVTWGAAARRAGRHFIWHQRSADNSRRLSLFSRLADEVLTISEHCKRSLAPGIRARARVVYDPFDTTAPIPDREQAHASIRQAMNLPPETRVVGFIGNLTRQKRPRAFVETARILTEHTDGALAFAMIGEERPEMATPVRQYIAQHGLVGHVHVLGPRFPIEPWLAGMDLLLVPAVNEGLGRTLVEAALAGTPVIATDGGGHREVIEDGVSGRLVPADDPVAFAIAAQQVLEEAGVGVRFAAAARKHVQQRFRTDMHVETVFDVYRSLVQ